MHRITLIQGDGIGPEVTQVAKNLINHVLNITQETQIDWDIQNAGSTAETLISDELLNSIQKNGLALKGPITTPIGTGFRSVNVYLRQHFNLYANMRPIKKIIPGRYETPIDFMIFRENTEGLYAGVEHIIDENKVVADKIVTRQASENIAKAAFNYAQKMGLDEVHIVHKANILKEADGLFLKVAHKVAEDYPTIKATPVIVDNMAMQLVMNPSQFKVICTTNLYGDILSDLSAGLVGGLGLAPGANMGSDIAIFEPVHGSAPDIAGQDLANPTACLLSSVMLLNHIEAYQAAHLLEKAIIQTLNSGKRTKDLGGTLTTSAYEVALRESIDSFN